VVVDRAFGIFGLFRDAIHGQLGITPLVQQVLRGVQDQVFALQQLALLSSEFNHGGNNMTKRQIMSRRLLF